MQYQVQPREIVVHRSEQIQVREEIQNFLRALDSYPARVAKEPSISFQQHLCSFFAPARDERHGNRFRRQ
ncbi:MAG: hypothetical protein WAL76_15600 [Candidatus Sulfotelmatobacter sp.]